MTAGAVMSFSKMHACWTCW